MSNGTKRPLAMLALACPIALIGTLASIGDAGATGTCTPDLLPTVIVGEPAYAGYTQPICARCVVVSKRETTADGNTHGVLELTYDDDVHPDFQGDIIVTVLLPDDTHETDVIPDVSLVEGEQASWTLDELPYATAEIVWVELQPAG